MTTQPRVHLTGIAHLADQMPSIRSLIDDDSVGFYASQPWLAATEALDEGTDHGYLLAEDGEGHPVGLMPVALPDGEVSPGYRPDRLFPYREEEPYLLCGPRRGYRTELAVRGSDVTATVAGLLDGAVEFADDHGREWVYALHLTTAAARALAETERVVPILSPLADCWLPAPGTSMDDYLASLGGHRRHSIRTDRRRAARSDARIERASLADCLDEVIPLVQQSRARKGVMWTLDSLRREYEGMARSAARQEILLTVRHDGELKGYALWFAWGDLLWGRSLALTDDLRTNAAPVLFELLFYRPLEICYELGLRGLHLGATNYSAKLMRGARLEPMWQVGLHRGREVFPREAVLPWTEHVLGLLREECGRRLPESRLEEFRAEALGFADGRSVGRREQGVHRGVR
ncbi:GNAT family N-acetyltransferase [Streptomyces sp. NPDC007856]|uniref:GNAT family N-acetyltransferase n=1 Tax=Streptomyces sp. NPDC007856 TaxID=3364781 RepID=UPI0036B7F81E